MGIGGGEPNTPTKVKAIDRFGNSESGFALGFIPIDALAPCEPTRLSNGEFVECHPDTVTGSTVSLLSAADQLALLLCRKHYREGSATGSAPAGDNSISLPETDRSSSRKHQRLPKQDVPDRFPAPKINVNAPASSLPDSLIIFPVRAPVFPC